MINLSFMTPAPTLTQTAKGPPLPVPASAPEGGHRETEGFARSLDRVQAPRPDAASAAAPAANTQAKPKADSKPPPVAQDGDSVVDAQRPADPLGAMQRTAAARQAALRSAAQAALAAEASKAGKTAADNAGSNTTVAAKPIMPPTECPAAGPSLGNDCEFRPDTAASDNGGLVIPPTVMPAELPQAPHTLPAPAPTGGSGGGPTALPPKLAPLPETPAPWATHLPAPWSPGSPTANTNPTPYMSGSDDRGSRAAWRRENDKADRPAPIDDRTAKGPPLPVPGAHPRAPLAPSDTSAPAALPPVLAPTLVAQTAARSSNGESSTSAGSAAAQSAAAALAAMLPTADNARSEPTPQALLQARPGSSEFAEQLGAMVSVWAKDGVQRASLQLNPLELGPVSVQIQLDGSGAQVTLAADLAATRQALEQALPTLAGTLREAGLTLTGGGVFDQARQQGGTDGNAGNSGSAGNAGNAASLRAAPESEFERAQRLPISAPRSRGVVDLMA